MRARGIRVVLCNKQRAERKDNRIQTDTLQDEDANARISSGLACVTDASAPCTRSAGFEDRLLLSTALGRRVEYTGFLQRVVKSSKLNSGCRSQAGPEPSPDLLPLIESYQRP